MKKIAIWILAIILLVAAVNALGVTPGRNTVNYVHGGVGTNIIKIVNDQNTNLNLVVYAQGDLKDSIQINQTSFKLGPEDKEAYIEVSYSLPDNLKPGTKEADIVIRDIGEESNGDLVISATLAVISQLYVMVPYPGKYAEAELDVLADEGKVGFYTRVFNRGSESINARVSYNILNKDGKKVQTLDVPEQEIKPNERKELIANWQSESAGDYVVEAVVNYGEEIKLQKEFTSGGELVKAIAISVDNFVLGEIAKLNILVENLAEADINDLSAELMLSNADGDKVADERSLPIELKSKDRAELFIYWDTKNLAAGTYKGSLTLKYRGKSVSKSVVANVAQNRIDVSLGGITGFAVAQQPARTDYGVWLPIIFVLGIIILIAIIITNVRMKRYVKKNE